MTTTSFNENENIYDLTHDTTSTANNDRIIGNSSIAPHLEALNIENNERHSPSLLPLSSSSDFSDASSDNNGSSLNNKSIPLGMHQSLHHATSLSTSIPIPATLSHNNNNNNNINNYSNNKQQERTNIPLLTACYMSALTTGATTYAFSFYSNALKSSLRLSQSQLDTLSSATFCAGILSWMPGMMVDIWGARLAMALGGMMNVCTLSMYWMIATERWKIHDLELLLVVLSSLGVLTFVGCALVTGSVFKVIVESCGSGTKGQAVGCAKGYVGVGSGVYVCLFGALFGGSGGGGGGGGAVAVAVTRPASLGVGMEEHNYMGNSLNWAWMLPSSSWISLAASSTTTTATTTYDATIPESPELNSLNFLLMASVLSFSAAVLPALIFLPKQTSSSSCRDRRDGTRPLHFRVIYAGLIALGAWVVGMSLLELKEENDEKNSRSSGESNVAPSLVDSLEEDFSWENNNESYFENDYSYHPTSISRKLWMAATRQLASASSPERHWGTAFFIILLWWGPALSLLFIPPRKECSDESDMIDNEELFMYDDEVDDGETDVGLSRSVLSRGHAGKEDEEETFLQEELPNRRALEVKDMNVGNDRTRPALGSDFTMLQMLRTAPAWLMAYPCVIIVGGGTVMTNNIGQMTEALGFDSDITPASLALFSAAQAASRVMTGSISESALGWNLPWFCGCITGGRYQRRGDDNVMEGGSHSLPRPAFFVFASLISAASHFILAVATTEGGFALGVTLSGVAFGMVWPLMVLVSGEVFGYLHYGANYMFYDGFSSAVGTLILSKFLAQTVYDENIAESHGDPGGAPTDAVNFKCYGTECFRITHVIVSFLSLTCIASSVGLVWSTRDVYQRH